MLFLRMLWHLRPTYTIVIGDKLLMKDYEINTRVLQTGIFNTALLQISLYLP